MKVNQVLDQARKIQEKIKDVKKELSGRTVEASAGGGMVTVVANCDNKILSVKIDPSVFEEGDVEMFEDLIAAATNEALRRSQEIMGQEMAKVSGLGGMNIPGLF
ncbi:MAG: YbaB/EbfC family nucleoid-associated protein [Nitrospinota bacterium]